MASLGNNVKTAFLKGLEALGKGASSMASNAHQKLNEINLETRRHELMSEVPACALDLWQKGVELPEPLGAMMEELSNLDEQLTVLRAQRYAAVGSNDAEAADTAEESGNDEADEHAPDEEAQATEGEPTEDEPLNAECECAASADVWAEADATAQDENEALNKADAAAVPSDSGCVEPPMTDGETGDNA